MINWTTCKLKYVCIKDTMKKVKSQVQARNSKLLPSIYKELLQKSITTDYLRGKKRAKTLKPAFHKECFEMAKKQNKGNLKPGSVVLVIKDMPVKIMVRYHHTYTHRNG